MKLHEISPFTFYLTAERNIESNFLKCEHFINEAERLGLQFICFILLPMVLSYTCNIFLTTKAAYSIREF